MPVGNALWGFRGSAIEMGFFSSRLSCVRTCVACKQIRPAELLLIGSFVARLAEPLPISQS